MLDPNSVYIKRISTDIVIWRRERMDLVERNRGK